MAENPVRLDDLIAHVKALHPGGDPLAHLEDAARLAGTLDELSDHLVGHFVDQARRAGASWTEIGAHMGVTKQAAQKRFVPRADDVAVPATALYERFTNRARVVLEKAEMEARAHGSGRVGTEHVVLGLLHEPEAIAGQAIRAQQVTLEQVREAAEAALPAPDAPATSPAHIPFDAESKKLLLLTTREALRLGHNFIGTEHILLALLEDPATAGAGILGGLGITKTDTEEFVRLRLAELTAAREQG